MRDKNQHQTLIGNDFAFSAPSRASIKVAPAAPVAAPAMSLPFTPIKPADKQRYQETRSNFSIRQNRLNSFWYFIHAHTFIVFSLLVLIIGAVTIELGTRYIMADDYPAVSPNFMNHSNDIGGLNKAISSSQLAAFEQTVTNQPATLNLGSQTVSISPSTIQSWLTTAPDTSRSQVDVHIDSANIENSLTSLVDKYTSSPVGQVTVTRSDGSSEVAVAGRNGVALSGSADLAGQSITIAKNLLSNKGFTVNAPLVTVPFQSLTPANFSKLIVEDLNSKRMYLYQNGQLINTFLTSSGKPSTPTPVGEFHIWSKLTSQTMIGPGYVQPNVPWVNYFDHKGDAIHGVYWRAASVFGNINTSHGCVGLPISNAEYVFNWAPIGTTVITTAN